MPDDVCSDSARCQHPGKGVSCGFLRKSELRRSASQQVGDDSPTLWWHATPEATAWGPAAPLIGGPTRTAQLLPFLNQPTNAKTIECIRLIVATGRCLTSQSALLPATQEHELRVLTSTGSLPYALRAGPATIRALFLLPRPRRHSAWSRSLGMWRTLLRSRRRVQHLERSIAGALHCPEAHGSRRR